jgi:hypothetical protein
MEQGLTPVVDFTILYRAVKIDAAIRGWNGFGDLTDFLFKQILWIYLWRTIYPLKSTSWAPERKITSAVSNGAALLKSFLPKDPVRQYY